MVLHPLYMLEIWLYEEKYSCCGFGEYENKHVICFVVHVTLHIHENYATIDCILPFLREDWVL